MEEKLARLEAAEILVNRTIQCMLGLERIVKCMSHHEHAPLPARRLPY